MAYTVGQAAKATGKSKPTISRAIKTGALSAIKNENGSYTIDPAELHRVFPPIPSSSNDNPEILLSETPSLQAILQCEIELLHERLADKDTVIDDLRRRLDTEGEERRRLTAIITDQNQTRPKPRRWVLPAVVAVAVLVVLLLVALGHPGRSALLP